MQHFCAGKSELFKSFSHPSKMAYGLKVYVALKRYRKKQCISAFVFAHYLSLIALCTRMGPNIRVQSLYSVVAQ